MILDVGLAVILGLGAGRVGGDAVRVGLLADELGEVSEYPFTFSCMSGLTVGMVWM